MINENYFKKTVAFFVEKHIIKLKLLILIELVRIRFFIVRIE